MSDEEEENLRDLTIPQLQTRLRALNAKITAPNKDELVQRLSDYIHRKKVLGDLDLDDDCTVITVDDHVLVEKRKVFKVPDKDWKDVESMKETDVPEGFTMEVLTKFLKTFNVIIGGEELHEKTKRAHGRGRKSYLSMRLKRAWFIKTDTKLLIGGNVASSMSQKIRYEKLVHSRKFYWLCQKFNVAMLPEKFKSPNPDPPKVSPLNLT